MSANTVQLTDATFKDETAQGLVLVDFWAPWCGPCRVVGPIIDELAADYQDRVKVGKLNVDDNPVTASTFRVRSIPTVILFKDGQPVETMIGAQAKVNYQAQLNKYLPTSMG